MNVQKLIRYSVSAAILAGAAAVWWACEFERTIDQVGPSAPLDMPLTQILNELANSQTKQEAEKAITHLLEKAGVGMDVKGSDYTEYYLPEEFVTELAQNHLLYRQGNDSTDWADAFEFAKLFADAPWDTTLVFDDIVARLQQQAPAALADPESPNHALLLAMLVHGTALPQSIAAPAPTGLVPPVQEFLFKVWMRSEFGDLKALEKKKPKGYTHFKFVFVKCDKGFVKEEKEKAKIPWVNSDAKACMEKVRTRYEQAVDQCYKTYICSKKKKKAAPTPLCCEQLKNCLLAAHDKALSDINDCLKEHDQGKGKKK